MRDINTPYITDPEEIAILEQSMHGEMQYTLMNDFLARSQRKIRFPQKI